MGYVSSLFAGNSREFIDVGDKKGLLVFFLFHFLSAHIYVVNCKFYQN